MLTSEDETVGTKLATVRALLEDILDTRDRYSIPFDCSIRAARQSVNCALMIWAAGLEPDTPDNPLSIDHGRALLQRGDRG